MMPFAGSASRFRAFSVRQLWLLFAAIAALIAYNHLPQPQTPNTQDTGSVEIKPQGDDLALYRSINARLAAGEDYYQAAATELREGGYPLRPFVTFRLPTLALASAALGPVGMIALCWCLVAGTLLVWWRRLDGEFDDPRRRVSGTMLIGAGLAIVAQSKYLVVHELWAGILLALAMGLHRQDRWLPSVLVGAAALAVRELALPCILLFGAFAVFERRWREAAAWTGVVALFLIALHFHSEAVAHVVTAADPASPGWMSFGGWQAFLRAMRMTSALKSLPALFGSALVILSLIGWASHKSCLGLFGTMLFAGYGLIFMTVGRPENFYWGLIVAPTFLLGLAFLPRAFVDIKAILLPATPLDTHAA